MPIPLFFQLKDLVFCIIDDTLSMQINSSWSATATAAFLLRFLEDIPKQETNDLA